tara:strand:+ start:9542 stop:10546 length:1005 start_codon:yes stop_codon:yes gene_type:complete
LIHAADLHCRDFTSNQTIRLIPTAYIDEPALSPLADSDDELDLLAEIEGLTSARLQPPLSIPGGLEPSELLSPANGYGWSYVNAAFCYTHAKDNRFNGAERGAWYAACGKNASQTVQAEVAWHLTCELENTGIFENTTAYRELIAGFNAPFHDLTPHPQATALDPSPAIAYPVGQALARIILASGGNGLLYSSVRHADGHCIAALRPHLVQNILQGDQWIFRWPGNPDSEITRARKLYKFSSNHCKLKISGAFSGISIITLKIIINSGKILNCVNAPLSDIKITRTFGNFKKNITSNWPRQLTAKHPIFTDIYSPNKESHADKTYAILTHYMHN